ncbi:hypothetical protein NADE_007024 [Nannochloris sp. 'desiccata']|nr:hypothetical protein NADE_007024 [Chlorella desiccata (nom. nud.)]
MATAITLENQCSDLENILENTSTSYVEPYAFFISWQGVLTLAFAGFPPAILDMKQRIAAQHPELPPESSGSKWPKSSLGCLRDGVTLTVGQFETLNTLCKNLSRELFSAYSNNTTNPSPTAAPSLQIAIDTAAIALYECRSLEKTLCQQVIPFGNGHDKTGPTPEEQQRVKLIVCEADDPEYYKLVAREGNRRAHYTAPALGATLMHPLHPSKSVSRSGAGSPRSHHNVIHMGLQQRGLQEITDRQRLFEAIKRFKTEVESAMPDMYYWFHEKSLHITLRAIIL